MLFSDKDLRQLKFDEKGFEGECQFDSLIAQSPASTYLQLQDLLLQWHNSPFQIDTVLFAPQKIYLFDVKNHEGEVYIEGDRWFYFSGKEMKNPLLPQERYESLIRPLLQSLGVNLQIEANVVFVNPEFTLFQANKNLPIILPTQLNSLIRKLGSVSMKSYDPRLIEAARKLELLHDKDSPLDMAKIPEYSYEALKKGTPCFKCGELTVRLCGRWLVCDLCGCKEPVTHGVLRDVEEHKLLFPKRFITVGGMIEWSGLDLSNYRMQKILVENLKMAGNGKKTFYS